MRFFHYTELKRIVASFGGWLPVNIQKVHHKDGTNTAILNHVCTYDTETTTLFFYDNCWKLYDSKRDINNYNIDEKLSRTDLINFNEVPAHTIVYLWTFTLYTEKWQLTVYGRRNSEFKEFIEMLQNQLSIQEHQDVSIQIYVHNLGFDFTNSLQNIFKFQEVFCRKPHRPMKVKVNNLLEFRCSYFLENSSLANLTKDNKKYKKIADFKDYNKIRLPHTDLSNDPVLEYAALDTASLAESVNETFKQYGRIDKIPLTSTGKLRLYVKKYRAKDRKSINRDKACVPRLKMYRIQYATFQGGDTHTNPNYSGKLLELLDGWDRRSSYPAVMVTKMLPSSPFYQEHTYMWKDLMNSEKKCFIGLFTFYEVECKFPIPYAKMSKSFHIKMGKDGLYDNGRIFKCEQFSMYCTNIDVELLEKSYKIKSITCEELYVANKAYLTDTERRMILEFYYNKTQLKNVKGEEENYARNKAYLNSDFGRNVTALLDAEVTYDNETMDWIVRQLTDEEAEEKLEKLRNKPQFTMYARGVFITAWARWELYRGIEIFGANHVYNDTDSVKGFMTEEIYQKFIELNKLIIEETRKALPEELFELSHPVTVYNEEQPIGTWEHETEKHKYAKFIAFGSKKYAYVYEGSDEVHVTISGLSKKAGKHLKNIEELKIGKLFTTEESGRTVARYQTDQPPLQVDGYTYTDKCSLSIVPSTYTLGITDEYEKFLNTTMRALIYMKEEI